MKQKNKIWYYPFIMIGVVFLFTNSCKKSNNADNTPLVKGTDSVTDNEGNVYKTVKIGTQWWMAENLKATKYRNGENIPQLTNISDWHSTNKGAYCNYDNDSTMGKTYGKLYNWYAVDDARALCPIGWHVPSDTEYTILTNYLGGDLLAGGKMKETGTMHWLVPNTDATNESGFSALPGGWRDCYGYFGLMNEQAYFWTGTAPHFLTAFHLVLFYNSAGVDRANELNSNFGFSIRCIKDERPMER
jgi:uncharacterized protein (TIGR02145 family)